jgi:putative hydrolases of HD superfamily
MTKNSDEIKKIISFIIETDKLKGVLRKTSPIKLSRYENSAEHSWQVILFAILFEKYANEPVDLLKVIKMLVIHDIVEIDVGDVFHYAKDSSINLYEKELKAAKRIFSILDEGSAGELLSLWSEFEERKTPEAKYAASIDRVIAFIINNENNGGTWKKYQITREQILDKNSHIAEGSIELWKLANSIVDNNINNK